MRTKLTQDGTHAASIDTASAADAAKAIRHFDRLRFAEKHLLSVELQRCQKRVVDRTEPRRWPMNVSSYGQINPNHLEEALEQPVTPLPVVARLPIAHPHSRHLFIKHGSNRQCCKEVVPNTMHGEHRRHRSKTKSGAYRHDNKSSRSNMAATPPALAQSPDDWPVL